MRLRVMTYNMDKLHRKDLWPVRDVIEASRADLVCLQEVASKGDAKWLAEHLPNMRCCVYEGGRKSQFAFLTTDLVRIGSTIRHTHRTEFVQAHISDRQIHALILHLPPGPDQTDENKRLKLLELWFERLGLANAWPDIIVGDFNTVSRADELKLCLRYERKALDVLSKYGYVDCYRQAPQIPGDPGNTFPSRDPNRRIDYIFASRTLAPDLDKCDPIRGDVAREASDHLPVWADFNLSQLLSL